MEQNKEPRNRPMNLQLIYDKGGKNKQWIKTVNSLSGAVKIGHLHVNK